MYDMYPWHTRAAADAGQAGPAQRRAQTRARATQAVQVALDRRDNGGHAAAEPTAGRTRQ